MAVLHHGRDGQITPKAGGCEVALRLERAGDRRVGKSHEFFRTTARIQTGHALGGSRRRLSLRRPSIAATLVSPARLPARWLCAPWEARREVRVSHRQLVPAATGVQPPGGCSPARGEGRYIRLLPDTEH